MSDLLTEPLVRLFLGLFAFLGVATITGRVLARRGGDTATVANLTSRIDSWWAMIAILAVTFLAGKIATILLFALVSFWCLREFISLTPTRASDHYTLAAAFYLFLPAQYVLLWDGWLSVFTIAIPVYAYLLLPVISVLRGETEDFLLRISKIQWALMLAVYCLSHAPALLMLRIEDYPVGPFGLLAFLLLIVQASDVLQYVFGKLFGKRRLAPTVSPNKTWEGLILGAGSATLLGGALHGLTPFGFTGALAMAATITIAGALGGLVLSAVKRSLGAKDWGTMIEGHGGMLDRMDSIAFAAPLFFHLTNYFYAP